MKTLEGLALRNTTEQRHLPSGRTIVIPAWIIHFPEASPSRMVAGAKLFSKPDIAVEGSYLNKPLVLVGNAPLFGELAIARILERDGWEAVWVDSYHSRKEPLFWKDLPDRSNPTDLAKEAPAAFDLYNRIVIENNGRGGFFDVLGWRDGEFAFIEYKGAGDKPNRNECRWIDAALTSGVPESALRFVLY
jgi:hypothetical protein